ncbi:cAMP-dependent protein kinase catalytic subunit [Tritrichomonas foetus]|uniref:cAMP-dependent protein kinase catalytic subunit n=1 Tax=Tritrichomonas foetus TaxID=1144522 RepID=A0A1J4K9J9_9EUKA|nr:cAMP-dependent protein kinase catalytic subunit [Tritrichomonas foetus]|eukprot:OHT07907.1 cAMP-dependent protein kinase catalytic subunit [Tritrichomonas foetus]
MQRVLRNKCCKTNSYSEVKQALQGCFKKGNVFDIFDIVEEKLRGRNVSIVKQKFGNEMFVMKEFCKSENLERNNMIMEKVENERRIHSNLHHPFITKLVGSYESDDKYYLIFEFGKQGDLQALLDSQTSNLSQKQIKIFIAELILSISYLHSMKIVHRDLKPSNIVISEGHLKLIDFGLAKSLNENEKCTSFCGTNEFVAPEVIEGKDYDYKVDIWSLGVIIFRLCCGYLPFKSMNLERLYDSITSGKYRIYSNVDDITKDLISKLLQTDPSKRITLEEVMNHPFFLGISFEKVLNREYENDFSPIGFNEDSSDDEIIEIVM